MSKSLVSCILTQCRYSTLVDRRYPSRCGFLPRDAMLARVLPMPLCPCLSVIIRCSIERGELVNVVFSMEASFDEYYTVLRYLQK